MDKLTHDLAEFVSAVLTDEKTDLRKTLIPDAHELLARYRAQLAREKQDKQNLYP